MPRFFMSIYGPITKIHPDPFVISSLNEGLEIIEDHFLPDLNPYIDMISIYEMPESSGRAELVWRFTGLDYCDGLEAWESQYDIEHGESVLFKQGCLIGNSTTLLEELLEDYDLSTDLINDNEDNIIGKILDDILDADIMDIDLMQHFPYSD